MKEMIFIRNADELEVVKLKTSIKLLLTVGAIGDIKFDAILEYVALKGVEDKMPYNLKLKSK